MAAPGPPGHEVVEVGLRSLARLAHRGALDADGTSGDGAGVLIQVPERIFGQGVAVASLFAWDDGCRSLVEEVFARFGLRVLGWRQVPVEEEVLGQRALAGAPAIWQGAIDTAGAPDQEAVLYKARRAAEREAVERRLRLYFPSCSARTLVYKGLLAGTDLPSFYPDLGSDDCRSQFIVFHQRYSTNTLPEWRLAQPFRLLAHNGEINTLAGNVAWTRAREAELPEELRDVIQPDVSDSASLDNVLELLVQRGFDLGEALMSLVPDAWEARADLAPRVRDFYRYQSTRFEPWDGPAALTFSDGRLVGAALDRNGLRPLRYQVHRSGSVVVASEAGVVDWEPGDVIERGRLGPGQLLLFDTREGTLLRDSEAKRRTAQRDDFGELADRLVVGVERHQVEESEVADGPLLQRLHGWGAEDVKMVVGAMAASGKEPVYSMGDDTPIAPLGRTRRRIYGYLRQRFAQVTNPPIDPLRERGVMSLRTLVGNRRDALTPSAQVSLPPSPTRRGRSLPPDTGAVRLLELQSPVIGDGELARLLESALVLDATFGLNETLAAGLERLCREAAHSQHPILVLSDRRAGEARLPIPMALAVGAVHELLLRERRRLQRDLVAVAGDVVDVHDLAMLVTAGATAVHPYLALNTARMASATPLEAEKAFRSGLEQGLLKVMAKMGISVVQSYCGARVFEALGLGAEVMSLCFPSAPSNLGGASFADLEELVRANHSEAFGEPAQDQLPDHGRVRFRKAGEWHAHNPLAVRALQKAARSGDPADFAGYRQLSTPPEPVAVRDLLDICAAGPRLALREVEPAHDIRRRFIATAMSLGALSPEAHTALAVAMNRIGGRSNSGEGGEDPGFYTASRAAENRIKQVASARFGVTREYLERADELEIKIAQGSKPGEGGQLPSGKVTELIARLRHTGPGIQLISPPPHHDIYSIEDLAQLIHDLKTVNPTARVGVKLVAESGVGTIAAGVVKALADYVLVSGHEGGTGASPLSSIKNAGVPWELGLAETSICCVSAGLRERVSLRTDGGLKSGRDVLVAALLGAEEFGFGTSLLVALGCDMARQCHLDTCPTGIATQKEHLRGKFAGDVQHVINYLTLVAEEVRSLLADMGARTLDEVVGRADLLRPRDSRLDLSFLLRGPAGGAGRRTWPRNRGRGVSLPAGTRIDNSSRAVAPGRGQSLSYRGSAGQSFGAWAGPGSELVLEGEANDYVGKGLSGGVIAIRPFPGDAAETPVLAGNTCLYGATAGALYVAGRVGERFAVRNSGASAVVEGAGDHFCEYMTAGTVVSLGRVGANAGAGMTGGMAYVRDWVQLNVESVTAEHLDDGEADALRRLVEDHLHRTGSALARSLLESWFTSVLEFRRLVPVAPKVEAGPAEPGITVTQRERPRDVVRLAGIEPAASTSAESRSIR